MSAFSMLIFGDSVKLILDDAEGIVWQLVVS